MIEDQPDLLTESARELNAKKRKQLLPWWIKVFMWIFLIFGIFIPVALVFGLLGKSFKLSLYGFETLEPFSIIGLSIVALFIFKGITAYSLLKEKDRAVTIAIADAIIGIIICTSVMLYPMFSDEGGGFVFRLEILLLVPYLVKLLKIRPEWEKATPTRS